MQLTFLGTGAGMPSKERNVTAIVLDLLQEINSLWLFDCGEATQHQILQTKIKPRKINKIFISHMHGDHIFGLPGLLSSRSFLGGDSPLTVYGPKGIRDFIETSLRVSGTHLSYPLHILEIDQGIIFEDDDFIVECLSLEHNVESFAYKIIEKDKLGELQVDRLKECGIKPGPIYQQIKENEETVLDDGVVLKRSDFIGEDKQGKKLAIFGDTRMNEDFSVFIKDVDVLVHEATFSHQNEQLAHDYFHTTTSGAARLAKSANVDTLICTHISSRYQGNELEQFKQEVQQLFPNSFVAYDFFTFEL